jgi:hypothetical protein
MTRRLERGRELRDRAIITYLDLEYSKYCEFEAA